MLNLYEVVHLITLILIRLMPGRIWTERSPPLSFIPNTLNWWEEFLYSFGEKRWDSSLRFAPFRM